MSWNKADESIDIDDMSYESLSKYVRIGYKMKSVLLRYTYEYSYLKALFQTSGFIYNNLEYDNKLDAIRDIAKGFGLENEIENAISNSKRAVKSYNYMKNSKIWEEI